MQKTVGDVMTRDVVTVPPEASFREAVRLIEERHVDALPVVDDTGTVIGVLAESDLLLKEELSEGPRGQSGMPWQRRRDRVRASATVVREAMSTRMVTVGAEASLSAAARLMHRHRVGGLPVVDGDRHLQGIVTRSDLLRVFLREDDDLCQDIRDALGPMARDVSCSVSDGRATLTGRVRLRSEMLGVAALAHRVAGVIEVDNRVHYDADDVQVAMVGP